MQHKKFNLSISTDLWNTLQELADSKGLTVTELMIKYLKLGLIVEQETVKVYRNGIELELII